MTNKNQMNSSVLQALLDLQKILEVSQDNDATAILKLVKQAIKLLQQKQKFLQEADTIFNQHRYNDKSLHFVKLENYRKQQIVFELSSIECKIFLFMITFMSQQNAIIIKQNELSKIFNVSKRDINKALKNLEEKAYITRFYSASKVGTGYIINDDLANTGKYNNPYFKKITPQDKLNTFYVKNLNYDVIKIEIDDSDTIIKANSIQKKA